MKIKVENLIETLRRNVEERGEQPITNKWLLHYLEAVKEQSKIKTASLKYYNQKADDSHAPAN